MPRLVCFLWKIYKSKDKLVNVTKVFFRENVTKLFLYDQVTQYVRWYSYCIAEKKNINIGGKYNSLFM